MVITPLIAAIIVGSFWTGVGTTALLSDDFDHHRAAASDIVITADVSTAHRDACHVKYRSYNENTDMYLGYDGSWHVCAL